MKRMVIVGTVSSSTSSSYTDLLRIYRLDSKAIKDIKSDDLAPVADKLGVINFADLQIPAVRELYPQYYKGVTTRLNKGASSCFVLGTFGDGGYVCIRPHVANDYIQVIPRSRLVADVKKGNLVLLNAVIEQVDSVDRISPITGNWEDMSYLKGRTLVDKADEEDCECGHTHDKRDKIGADETVDSHDELGMLNPEQKEFLKNYYIEYSIDTFNKLVGKSSWTLKKDHEITEKNNKKRESKIARLAELRTLSSGDDWRFAGLWDLGRVCTKNEKEHQCEFGHNLRYIYRACPVNKTIDEARQEGTLLQFGIVCHADFLNIPPEEAARLGKLLNTMCSEIAFISTVVANVAVDKHNGLMTSMHELLGRLDKTGNLASIVGDRLAKAYKGFISNKLPLVESIVLDILTKFTEHDTVKVLSASGLDTSMFAPNPTDIYTLPALGSTPDSWAIRNYPAQISNAHTSGLNALYRTHEAYPTVLTTYADMLLRNDIAGEYMYNPVHSVTDYVKGKSNNYQRYGADELLPKCHDAVRKYKFGYNADTRELRERWMRYFKINTFDKDYITAPDGTMVRCLTMQGLERLILLSTRLKNAGLYIDQAVEHSALVKLMYELTEAYRNGSASALTEYATLHPTLLLTALPYTVNTGCNQTARRAASYILEKSSSKALFDSLDITKDGTDPEYIAELKFKCLPPSMDGDSIALMGILNEKVDQIVSAWEQIMSKVSPTAPVDVLEAASKDVTSYFNKCNDVVVDLDELVDTTKNNPDVFYSKESAYKHMTEIQNSMSYVASILCAAKQALQTSAPQTSQANPYRGDAGESKKMSEEFTSLYESLPKTVTSETTIQIALDIIKRFRTKFQEKEGFTSKEKWRVSQELDRLKRLSAQRTS